MDINQNKVIKIFSVASVAMLPQPAVQAAGPVQQAVQAR
jgi:hypothetical protein